jgi:hypothetical protein
MDEDKPVGDAQREAAAQPAPGGPAEFVQRFLTELWADHFYEAATFLDPEYESSDPAELDLGFLQDAGWAVSGRPRPTEGGDEIVLYVYGVADIVITDRPTVVKSVKFVVRHRPDAWSLIRIDRDFDS